MTLAARIIGVLQRPRSTLGDVAQNPRWLGVLVFSTVTAASAGAALMQTPVGRQALVDQWERTSAAAGHDLDDAGYARLEALSGYAMWYAAGSAALAVPILTVGAAGVIHRLARSLPGRGARPHVPFATVLAVAAHAAVILALRQAVIAPVTYLRESTANAMSLGLWFPSLDAASPAARVLGFVDLFVVWWGLVLALGIAIVYNTRLRTVACGVFGFYAACAAMMAAILALVRSSF